MLDLPRENSARIVAQALSFERPDRLPVFDGFWSDFEKNWRTLRNVPEETAIEDWFWSDLAVPVAQECFFPSQVGTVRTDGGDTYLNDGWGRIVRRREGAFFGEPMEQILAKPADLDALTFEPAGLETRYGRLLTAVTRHRQAGRAVFVKIGGPYIRSGFLRGEPQLLMDLAADEGFARALVTKVGEHLLQIGLESMRRAKAQDSGVWIYDDMCNVNAPMFSPRTFERVFLPVYQRIVSELKKAGARWVILHSDGNLTPLLDLVVEAGIDGINPVEYGAGMDIVTLAEKYRGRLRFIGGLCNTHILPSGDLERVRDHVEAIIEAARDGGIIIGTHSVGPDIAVETYEAYRRIVAASGDRFRQTAF